MPESLLATYLKNHLAGSAAELELAKRAASSFTDSPEASFLLNYVREIEEQQPSN